ncbi:Uncharacterised protein [Ewingella americana]|uniref:Uncharacterized protein n=1 Tax=Ewingella americana TaxID=41202 RepID=A0A377NAY3_9GAMM|nr:Uncharacterised protein [Ewingella americana]
MIIYHPFRDANHCLYRIINLLYKNESEVNEGNIGFMDFYYLFPSQLTCIDKWPRSNSKLAKNIREIQSEYENIENPRRIFFELNIVRKNTLSHLLSKGVVSLNEDVLCLHENKVPQNLITTLIMIVLGIQLSIR